MESSLWIPKTKLVPPQAGRDILARPELLENLYQAVTRRRLTLLSAPAGSGKTVTAASFLQAFPELLFAWLSIDEDDNDPVTFLWSFVAALQERFPESGSRAISLMNELPNPGAKMQRVLGVLVNEVLELDPAVFVYVIDDYHLIEDPTVQDAVAYLLERLPEPWRLLIATRRDPPLPLARLRARGQLETFTLNDLRFSNREIQNLFNDKLSIRLPPEIIKELHTRTEGWIAALRLLGNTLDSIGDAQDRDQFVRQFAPGDRHIFDLLAEEVLDRQPLELQSFLLETSILKVLTPDLCEAVTGRTDAPRLLGEAFRRNLFLSAVGAFESAVDPNYRYHDLFADFLQHRLSQEQPCRKMELHRRAAAVETTPARAIHHYLNVEAWEEAAAVIEKHGLHWFEEGQIARLQRWILALPENVRSERPWLNYLLAMCYGDSGKFDLGKPYLETALQQFSSLAASAPEIENYREGVTAASVAMAYHAMARHDFAQTEIFLEEILRRSLPPHERVRALINRAWLMLYRNNWSQVDADTEAAMEIARSTKDRGAMNVLAHQLRIPFIFGGHGIQLFEDYCQFALDEAGEEVSVIRTGALALSGIIRFLHGDLEAAIAIAREAYTSSRQLGGFVWMDMEWDIVLLGAASIRGDYRAYERRWQQRSHVYEHTGARQWLIPYLYRYGRTLWMQNRWEEMLQIIRRIQHTSIEHEPPESRIARKMSTALVHLQEKRYPQAETLLLEAVSGQHSAQQVRPFFDARFMLAYLYHERGRLNEAVSVLTPVLNEMQRLDAPGLILLEGRYVIPLMKLASQRAVQPDFAGRVLRLFDVERDRRPIPIPGSTETITPREAEVLQLLMSGATNKEIAEQLVITVRTAKAHVSSILRKLAVSSRTEAVIRARELSLPID